jgi:hypothetical protein
MIRRTFFDADYDSQLGYPDQENKSPFKIVVKVFLKQFNPNEGHTYDRVADDSDGRRIVKFQKWTDAEWKFVTTTFKKEIEKYLNWPRMKLWLLPTTHRKDRMSQIQLLYFRHRHPVVKDAIPAVQCGLTVQLVQSEKGAHVWWDVIRVKDGEKPFRSADINDRHARDRGMLTNQDIERWARRPSDGVPQSTVTHEIGHVLNLDHINQKARACKNGDEDICYGERGTQMRKDWMGGGNQASDKDAGPWLERIPLHARNLNWQVTTNDLFF